MSEDEQAAAERKAVSSRILERILPLIPEDQRRAIVENILAGRTYEEIAAEEGIERTTVGTRVNRARGSLLEILRNMGIESAEDVLGSSGQPNKKVQAQLGKKRPKNTPDTKHPAL